MITFEEIGSEVYKKLGGKVTRREIEDFCKVFRSQSREVYVSTDQIGAVYGPIGVVRPFKCGSLVRSMDHRYVAVASELRKLHEVGTKKMIKEVIRSKKV